MNQKADRIFIEAISEVPYNSISSFCVGLTMPAAKDTMTIIGQAECIGEASGAGIISTTASVELERDIRHFINQKTSLSFQEISHEFEKSEEARRFRKKMNDLIAKYNSIDPHNAFCVSITLLLITDKTLSIYKTGRGTIYLQEGKKYQEIPFSKPAAIVSAGSIIMRSHLSSSPFEHMELQTPEDILIAIGNTDLASDADWSTLSSTEKLASFCQEYWHLTLEGAGQSE